VCERERERESESESESEHIVPLLICLFVVYVCKPSQSRRIQNGKPLRFEFMKNTFLSIHQKCMGSRMKPYLSEASLLFACYVMLTRGPFLTSPLGANFHPQERRGEFCPLGVKFSVHPFILLNNRECSLLGVNEGVNIPPRETKSTSGGQVHPYM
jgi:hypothetical protein